MRKSSNHNIPKSWEQFVVRREPDNPPGPPIIWSDPQNPEDAQPGYGYIADDTNEEETFFYHSDHLGSTSYITDDKGNVTQYTAYLPYGELLVDEHSSSEELPYKFNGKELDEETGLYYYGARYLQPMSGIFLNPDRFTAKYPNLSAYNYCAGNPIKYIDVNGDSVRIIFNKDKMELHMLDMDNYNSKKGLNYVSYENYKEGQENQVLVIPFVFSGGEVNDDGVVVINPEKKHIQRALPNGVYDILDNTSDTNPIHSTWYRLDRKDKSRYDDRDDYTKRSGFRLHLGLESHGCVTINRDQNNSKEMWNVLNDIMNKTSTKQVKENRGRQWLNPFSKRKWYGTMVVIGND